MMSDTILTANNLNSLQGIHHAFFTRPWGTLCFSDPQTRPDARQAREKMAEQMKVSTQNFLCCHQIHSSKVVTVAQAWDEQDIPQADAMVTDKRDLALAILTADCVPVLFSATNAPVIGAAHAGWRGALGGVLEQTVQTMENLGADRTSIHAALGPCIWQKSYEVSTEFLAPFFEESPEHYRFFFPSIKPNRFLFDLPGYVTAKLRGLNLASIEASPADTCAEPDRFYSHRYSTLRNEQRQGNLISAIVLR